MHSVPHHSLDVAASATVLLTAFRPPVDVPAERLAALVALHDVGKFTRPFQAKVPELWPRSRRAAATFQWLPCTAGRTGLDGHLLDEASRYDRSRHKTFRRLLDEKRLNPVPQRWILSGILGIGVPKQ
jgi:hypothetical protein